MRLSEQYAEHLKEAQSMGAAELRDTIIQKDFLSAEQLNGGYKFMLSDKQHIFELNTVTGSLRLISQDFYVGDKVVYNPEEKITLNSGLLHAINKAVARDFAHPIRVYTLQEVADILKVTRQTIYNYVTAGRLRATKFGKEYRVTEADLQELIQRGRN